MLLESYEEERIPHVKEYIMMAVRLGELICSETPSQDLKTFKNKNSPNGTMQSLTPALGSSRIFKNFEKRKLGSGFLFGQPNLLTGEKMDDVYPYQPVLVSMQPMESDTYPIISSHNSPVVEQMLLRLNAHSVLIRPDRYILAIAKNEKEALAVLSNGRIQQWFI